MTPVRFHRLAEQELIDSAKYYSLQASGLGAIFLDKIESAIQDISIHPLRWPVLRHHIRRRLIHRFPFAILYRADPSEIIIIAIMHLRRHPDYWTDRT